jgi:hypothetical protein
MHVSHPPRPEATTRRVLPRNARDFARIAALVPGFAFDPSSPVA